MNLPACESGFVCEKCRSAYADVNYAIPETISVGTQSEWNLCHECMAAVWSQVKSDFPTSEAYLSARFQPPYHHDHMSEPGDMA